jgi:hypothetical protein
MTGFDIATMSGPLCEEPMLGSVFLIETIELVIKSTLKDPNDTEEEKVSADSYGAFTG